MSEPLGPMMVDISGETLSTAERDFLQHPAIGAVILFDQNYHCKEQVRALSDEIKAIRSPALLVAVDQEGGRVQRFRKDFHTLPAAGTIGALYDQDRDRAVAVSETVGCLMATEVVQVGVDFSFAPVLDCANPNSKVIGDRAFHQDPAAILELASAYITGMNCAGMAATGKHFPGHGFVSADSHDQQPIDPRTWEQVEQHDISPFLQLANRMGGIMTAHILFGQIAPELPTYSTFWLQQVLRKNLAFSGAIFSDDLSMKGAGDDVDLPTKSVAALNAGCDMVLLLHDPDNARRAADRIERTCSWNALRVSRMRATPPPRTDANICENLNARLIELWN